MSITDGKTTINGNRDRIAYRYEYNNSSHTISLAVKIHKYIRIYFTCITQENSISAGRRKVTGITTMSIVITYKRIHCRPRSPCKTVLLGKDARRSCRDAAAARSRFPCSRPRRCNGSFSSDRTTGTVRACVPDPFSDGVVCLSFCDDVFGVSSSFSSFSDAAVVVSDDVVVSVVVVSVAVFFVSIFYVVVSPDPACLSFAAFYGVVIAGGLYAVFFGVVFSAVFGLSFGDGVGDVCVCGDVAVRDGSAKGNVAIPRICRRSDKADRRTSSAGDRTSAR